MKKLAAVSLFVVILISFIIPISAAEYGWEEDFEGEIGEIVLPEGTPTVDGIINEGEGWSEAQYFDKTNTEGGWGGETVDVSGELYRAFDDENLYIAVNINIPEYSLCVGEDWIDGDEDGNRPGWDGDVFILSLDPLQALLNEGFGNDPAAWYCFGLFEGDQVRVYRTHINAKEISDTVPAAGKTTDTGWIFEAAIPWETICTDLDDVSYGFAQLTPDDILQEGNMISAAMIYYDRRYDPEAEQRITHSRYVTVATTLPDGTPGVMATPWKIQAHGIYMMIDEVQNVTEESQPVDSGNDTQAPPKETKPVDTIVSDTSADSSTKPTSVSTNKQNASSSTGASSPQTFDMGFALAASALAISGIGIVSAKHKKK